MQPTRAVVLRGSYKGGVAPHLPFCNRVPVVLGSFGHVTFFGRAGRLLFVKRVHVLGHFMYTYLGIWGFFYPTSSA